jgi:hypothetical protein
MFLSNLKNISINIRKKNISNIKKYSDELKLYIEVLQNGGSSNGVEVLTRLLETEVRPVINKLKISDSELEKIKKTLFVIKSILTNLFDELNSLDDKQIKELEKLPNIIKEMNNLVDKRLQTF